MNDVVENAFARLAGGRWRLAIAFCTALAAFALTGAPASAQLSQLTVPWCMIWGGDDRSAPLDPLGNGMHAMFPEVPFHVVEGSGHQVQNDKPEECNRLLLEFFGVRQAAAV